MDVAWLTDPFKDAIKAALQSYGAGVVLLVLATIAMFVILQRSWTARLSDKDKEIERMAERIRELEKLIVKHRISSVPAPSGKSGGN